MSKSKLNSVDWLEGFGQSKSHDIFFIKSAEIPLQMALTMERLFHRNFRIIGSFPLDSQFPNRQFPMFFANLNISQEANLVLIPNSIIIPAQDLEQTSDPLLGGFLFDEEYYVFNNNGNALFKSEFNNYGYILMLSCNKNCSVTDDVIEILSSVQSFRTIQKTDLLTAANNKATEKKRVDFLQRLFIDLEIAIASYMEEMLCRRMNWHTDIPAENYTVHRFQDSKISLLPLMSNPLMRREDI